MRVDLAAPNRKIVQQRSSLWHSTVYSDVTCFLLLWLGYVYFFLFIVQFNDFTSLM